MAARAPNDFLSGSLAPAGASLPAVMQQEPRKQPRTRSQRPGAKPLLLRGQSHLPSPGACYLGRKIILCLGAAVRIPGEVMVGKVMGAQSGGLLVLLCVLSEDTTEQEKPSPPSSSQGAHFLLTSAVHSGFVKTQIPSPPHCPHPNPPN